MDASLLWTIIGGLAGCLSAYIGWRQLRLAKVAVDRTVDVRLWRHGDRSLEAYVTLRNGGVATAIMDCIEVQRPRKTKVAWHFEPTSNGAKSLKDENVTNRHDVRVIAEPGKAVGCGMIMELPQSADRVQLIKMRARVSANDLAKQHIWVAFSAKPSMATDQRPVNKSMLGIPEDARP